jgi:hypothetical protein
MIEQPVGFVGYSASDLAGSAMIPGSEYDSTRYAVQHISGPFILRGQLPLKPSVDSQRPDARHRPPAVPLVSPHSGYGLYTLPPPLVCCRDRGGGGPAPGVAGLHWCGGAGGYAGRRAAGGPLLVSYCESSWLDDDRYCSNGLFGYLDAAGQRPGDEPLARELRRQQTLFSDLLGAMEGEGRAPRLAKAYHADEHAALHRES